MKISLSVLLLSLTFVSSQSPFFDQDKVDENMLKYQKTGKMEQIGRTGVPAMHAVLLK